MINKIAVITTALILATIGLLLALAFHYYGKTVSQARELVTLTQKKMKPNSSLNLRRSASGYLTRLPEPR